LTIWLTAVHPYQKLIYALHVYLMYLLLVLKHCEALLIEQKFYHIYKLFVTPMFKSLRRSHKFWLSSFLYSQICKCYKIGIWIAFFCIRLICASLCSKTSFWWKWIAKCYTFNKNFMFPPFLPEPNILHSTWWGVYSKGSGIDEDNVILVLLLNRQFTV